jgi:hypothetical protein
LYLLTEQRGAAEKEQNKFRGGSNLSLSRECLSLNLLSEQRNAAENKHNKFHLKNLNLNTA